MSIFSLSYSLALNFPLVGNFLQHRHLDPLLNAIDEHLPKLLYDKNERVNSLEEINRATDLAENVTQNLSIMIQLTASIAIVFFTTCVAGVIAGGIAAFVCVVSLIDAMALHATVLNKGGEYVRQIDLLDAQLNR